MIRQAHEGCASCDDLADQRPHFLTDEEYSVTIVASMDDLTSLEPTHWAIIVSTAHGSSRPPGPRPCSPGRTPDETPDPAA